METNTQVVKNTKLERKSLLKSWFTWICFGQICYNYERMMGLGFWKSYMGMIMKNYLKVYQGIWHSITLKIHGDPLF